MDRTPLGDAPAAPLPSTIVRTAKIDDVPGLVALSEIWHRDCEMFLHFDPVRVAQLLNRLFSLDERIVILAEDHGRMVGMLLGFVTERWFSAERVAQTLAFVVRPDHRSGNTADRLLVEFQAQAIQRGANIAEIGMLSGHGFAASRGALDRADFQPVGTCWAWSAADHLVDDSKGVRH